MRDLGLQVWHRSGDERGMTIIELSIAAMLSMVVFAIFAAALISVQGAVNQQTHRSINNDQVRLAAEQLDREVRSGSLLYNPDDETVPGQSLRVYSPTATADRCIQWRIEDRQLLRRTWEASFGAQPDLSTVSPWRTVAEHVVNRDLSPEVSAFSLVGSSTAAVGRTVQILLLVNSRFDSSPDQTVTIRQSIYGRNTSRGTASNQQACAPAPPN